MTSDVAREPISTNRLRATRILTGAAVAALSAIPLVADTAAQHAMTETWRLYGLLVFAGLFVLLAWRPQGYRWLWEIVILNKLLLTLTAGYFLVRAGDVETAGAVRGGRTIDGRAAPRLVIAQGWRSR